jgi:O-antigen ligase
MNVGSALEGLVANRPIEYVAMSVFIGGLIIEWLRRSPARAARPDAQSSTGPTEAEVTRPHPAVWFLPLWLVINALDVKGYFLTSNHQQRYALGFLFLAMCLLARRRGTALSPGQRLVLVVFVLYVVLGALDARFYSHPQSSSLPMAAGVIFLLIPLFSARLAESEIRWLVRWIAIASTLELFVHFLAACEFINSGINRDTGPVALYSNGTFTHEKAAIAFMAFHLLRRRANWILQLGAAMLMLIIFANYPAGTYLYAFGGYLVVMLLVRFKKKPARVLVVGMSALTASMVSFVLGGGGSFEQHYYNAVGKTDNTSTRQILWSAAMQQIKQHPWFGSYFHGEASVHVEANNLLPLVPPHNDYLNIALLGGWVALAIFALVSYQQIATLCQFLSPRGESSSERRLAGETVLVGVTVTLMIMMFNPSLLKVSLSALFFCLLGVGSCIGTRREPPAPRRHVPPLDRARAT